MLALSIVALASAWAWRYGEDFPGVDYFMHWAVVDVLPHDGVPPLYSETGIAYIVQNVETVSYDSGSARLQQLQRPAFATPGTPFLHTALLTLHTGDYDRDYTVFRAATIAATLLGVFGLGIHAGLSPLSAALLYALATTFSDAYASALRTGNVSQLQLGGLAVFFFLAGDPASIVRRGLAAVVLGALLCFKPNLWAIVPCVLVAHAIRGESRTIAANVVGLGIGAALAVASSSFVYGSESTWREWATYVRQFAAQPPPLAIGNFALPNLLAHWGSAPPTPLLAGVTLGVFAVSGSLQRRTVRSMHDGEVLLWATGAGIAVSLLATVLAWVHYFNLIVPLAVYLLARRGGLPGSAGRAAAIVGLALVAGKPVGWLLGSPATPVVGAACALAGVALMFAAACILPTCDSRSAPQHGR